MNKLTTMGAIMLMLISIFAVGVSADAPTFSPGDQTMAEGTLSEFTLSASHGGLETVLYAKISGPAWVTVSSTGTVTMAPGYTEAASSPHLVTVSASHGADPADLTEESFNVIVTDVTPSNTLLVVSDVTLGSDRQVRSNPDAEDDEDQNVFTTGTFTITNNGPDPFTSIVVTSAIVIGSELDYNFTFIGVPSSLAPGAAATVTVRARVPEDLDAVDVDSKKVALLVANLRVEGTLAGETLSTTNDVTMEAENQLQIKKMKVCVNGDCETVDDGDKVDALKPGDLIEITFKIKNRFRDNDAEDIEIEDVEVFVEINDDDFDIDEGDDLGDIGPNDEEEVTISFEVEDDAGDGTVTMQAWVEGEDEHGAKHGELFEVRLEVERERHEVSLRNVRLDPDTLSCNAGGDQTIVMTLELQNTGRDDEDEVTVEIKNAELGLTKVERNIEIDEDDRDRKTYTLRIPGDAESGVYALSVKTFTRRDDLSDSDDVLLTIPACAPREPVVSEPVEEEEEEIVVVSAPAPDMTTPPAPAPADASATPVASSSGTSSANSGMYVALLVAIIIVLVIIGVMLVNALAKR